MAAFIGDTREETGEGAGNPNNMWTSLFRSIRPQLLPSVCLCLGNFLWTECSSWISIHSQDDDPIHSFAPAFSKLLNRRSVPFSSFSSSSDTFPLFHIITYSTPFSSHNGQRTSSSSTSTHLPPSSSPLVCTKSTFFH